MSLSNFQIIESLPLSGVDSNSNLLASLYLTRDITIASASGSALLPTHKSGAR